MNSRHLTGHAVDLGYWLDDGDGVPENGEIRWDWPLAAAGLEARRGDAAEHVARAGTAMRVHTKSPGRNHQVHSWFRYSSLHFRNVTCEDLTINRDHNSLR
jgi:hypothetical protein